MPNSTRRRGASSRHRPPRKRTFTFDKARFFADIGYTPRPDQWAIHTDPSDLRVPVCGVRYGKSKVCAMEGSAESIAPRDRCVGWVVAPTYDLAEKVFREILYTFRTKLPEFIREASDSRLLLRHTNIGGGLSEIRGKSADHPDSLLGEALDWLVVDEAARVKPNVWESYLSQRLMDKRGWAMFPSTPKGKNWYYRLAMRGHDPLEAGRVRSWTYPTSVNPLIRPDDLAAAKRELPEVVYQQEYDAKFLDAGGLVFRNVERCAHGQLEPPSPSQSYLMGVDLAKYKDFTVLAVLDRRGRLCAFERFTQLDWAVQKQRIRKLSAAYNAAPMLLDSTGVGDPIYEDLARLGLPVTPYQFTESSKKALIDNLIVEMEAERISFPPIPELVDELEAYSYELTSAGRLRRNAPSGYHDDCVIALALAAWQLSGAVDVSQVTVGDDLSVVGGF